MTIILGVAVIAWAAMMLWLLRMQARALERAHAQWTDERRELLNRIQHPEIVPTRAAENFVIPDREPDDWNKIGTIELDLNGTGDDGAA